MLLSIILPLRETRLVSNMLVLRRVCHRVTLQRMGRQQTLGETATFKFFLSAKINLGKFFEMPKGIKTAPPQQASLNELWKGKGKQEKRDASPKTALDSSEKQDIKMEDVQDNKAESPSSGSERKSSPRRKSVSPKPRPKPALEEDERQLLIF